jgi:hypothetical protein
MSIPVLRTELFERYGLDWELGVPPDASAPSGTADTDLSRFFATDDRSAGDGSVDNGSSGEESADNRPTTSSGA